MMISHDIEQIVNCPGSLIFLNEGKIFSQLRKEEVSHEKIISLFGRALQSEPID